MYFIYYFRWVGTSEELKEYIENVKAIADDIKEVQFKGIFAPSSAWNFVFLLETANFEKVMDVYRTYIHKYGGQHPKVPVGKLELLFTVEEIGFPQ